MYDIYLFAGCHQQPTPQEFGEDEALVAALLAAADLMAERPGFLHLDLSDSVALRVRDQLRQYGARGWVLPSAYRTPRITKEQAYPIAAAEIAALQATYAAQYTFDPVRFKHDDPMRWVFMSLSPELVAEGRAPGALHAEVDKVDGHIWQDGETESIFGGIQFLRSKG